MSNSLALDNQIRLARVWQAKGHADRAASTYREILARAPDCLPAVLAFGELTVRPENLPEIETFTRSSLLYNPTASRLHKQFINVIEQQRGLDAAYAEYGLELQSDPPANLTPDDVLCCLVARNERARLPFFLQYYRQKGVTQFLVVDNASTDETLSFLQRQSDVRVWQTVSSYNEANHGTVWLELLLRRYCKGHWCIIADADEILYYPDCETVRLAEFCQRLDVKRKRAMKAIMLDMYADKSIKNTNYEPGQDFLEVCPFFDRRYYHRLLQRPDVGGNPIYVGGMRERVFGQGGNYFLSKISLLKYDVDCVLDPHWTNLTETDIATERGCLLHFKYFSSFSAYVEQEIARGEHYDHAFQYKIYAEGLAEDQDLTLFDKDQSVEFLGSRQLLDMGIIRGDAEDRR